MITGTLYCGSCRDYWVTKSSPSEPPYAVLQKLEDGGGHTHLHPITRELLVELDEHLDDLVEAWHTSPGSLPLHEYLGMSHDEYAAWVTRR